MTFPASATGQFIKTQRRICAQSSILDLDSFNTVRDFRQNGGPLSIEKGRVPRLAYDSSGAPLAKLAGKTILANSSIPLGDVDPSDYGLIHLLANLFGQYLITDNTTWYHWYFGLDQATAASTYLKILEDNDAWPRMRFLNCRVGGMTLSADVNGNYAIEFLVGRGRYDFFELPVQTVGSGSTLPTVIGAYQASWTDAGDVDIFLEAQVVSGSTITLRTKVGTAAAYSNTQTYVMGDPPLRLQDESGAELGDSYGEPIMVYWPAGSTLVTLDAFQVGHQTARWTQSLGTAQPIPAVNTQLFADDDIMRAEGGWTLTANWGTFGARPDVSMRQGAIQQRAGTLDVTFELNREMVDSTWQAKLHNSDSVAIVIDARTDSTIVAGQPYVGRFVIPAGELSGSGATPNVGANNTDETLVFEAGVPAATYTYDGDNFDTHFACILHNNRSAL